MAKRKTMDEAATDAAPSDLGTQTVAVSLPILAKPGLYTPRHVDVRLDAAGAAALRQLYDGLDAAGERLKNGRRVNSHHDAVRWLFERIVEALPNG